MYVPAVEIEDGPLFHAELLRIDAHTFGFNQDTSIF